MNALTRKQFDTLIFIQDYTVANNKPPLVKDIAAHFNVSSSTISERLNTLSERGYVRREKWVDHSIYVVRMPEITHRRAA